LTPQRAAVLDVVREAHDHPTARDIYRRVKGRAPGIGFATVYRTLNLLADHGEVLELQLGDDAVARYDGNTGHHDHLVCTNCGEIVDLSVPLPDAVLSQAARRSGYDIHGYELQFHGRCRDCREG
jgi:Fur family ferric uptake transcriptional regulator/Fur family peroxide stress response transcriptional regulator